jgi:hypothetical protein
MPREKLSALEIVNAALRRAREQGFHTGKTGGLRGRDNRFACQEIADILNASRRAGTFKCHPIY